MLQSDGCGSRVDERFCPFTQKLKLKYWALPCQERFKFGAGGPVVCKTADFIPFFFTLGLRDHASFCGARKINAADKQRHIESVGSTI